MVTGSGSGAVKVSDSRVLTGKKKKSQVTCWFFDYYKVIAAMRLNLGMSHFFFSSFFLFTYAHIFL